MVSLGGFILFFGFLAFNGGSEGKIADGNSAAVVALAIVNTILSGMFTTHLINCLHQVTTCAKEVFLHAASNCKSFQSCQRPE